MQSRTKKVLKFFWELIPFMTAVLTVTLLYCLVFIRPAAASEPLDLLVGQQTIHFHDHWNWEDCGTQVGQEVCQPYNDSQELIGLRKGKYSLLYIHQNSLREKSLLFVRTWEYDLTPNVRPWSAAGLGTGYDKVKKVGGTLTPVGYLGLDLHPKSDRFGLLVTWVPESFVGLGLRVRL
jgi:hypothetical protein